MGDAWLCKDSSILARVILRKDEKNDFMSSEFEILSLPGYSAAYLQLSEHLELDMSTNEVLAALEKTEYYTDLEHPRIYINTATNSSGIEYDVIRLHYNDYIIKYYQYPDMPIVEILVHPVDSILDQE